MKNNSKFKNVLFALLLILLVSSCVARETVSVPELMPTKIPVEKVNAPLLNPNTLAEVYTSESVSTAKLISESAIPSRIEFAVQNASFEVKVIGVDKPDVIYPGGDFYFLPGEGQMFLDIGIKVSNLTSSDIRLKWSAVYLTNKYQERWYPTWGSYQQSNSVLDPLKIEIFEFQIHPDIDPDAHFYLDNSGYLRVIFRVPQDNLYYSFGFNDLPLIEIDYRRLNDQPILEIPVNRR